MRLVELLGTLSLAADAGMGLPPEQGLRSASVAVRFGELLGCSSAECAEALYLSLLRYVGCTSDSDLAARVMGDEVSVRGEIHGVDWGAPSELIVRMARAVGRAEKGLGKVRSITRAAARMPELLGSAQSHCEVGDQIALRVGFGDDFRRSLFQTFERWDGKGWPRRLKGEAVALPMRLAHFGEEVEIGFREAGEVGALSRVRKRAKHTLDPRLAERFERYAHDVCAVMDVTSQWKTLLELEPKPWRTVTQDGADEVFRVMADFADLKSRYTRGHSRGVATLVRRAAGALGLSNEEATVGERAGLVHDLGRVAIGARVWDKPGPLTDPEWERVRMHTYVGERILSRAGCLAAISNVAALAHERLDGSGYHRKLAASATPVLARVLAAADVYSALTEERPHRSRQTPEAAVKSLSQLVDAGALCPEAVRGVLAVVGHPVAPRRRGPSGLTERELHVLRLVARGLTNKEVASALSISTKTAGNHLQNVFEKLGVTTRAAATMYAMQHGLLEFHAL